MGKPVPETADGGRLRFGTGVSPEQDQTGDSDHGPELRAGIDYDFGGGAGVRHVVVADPPDPLTEPPDGSERDTDVTGDPEEPEPYADEDHADDHADGHPDPGGVVDVGDVDTGHGDEVIGGDGDDGGYSGQVVDDLNDYLVENQPIIDAEIHAEHDLGIGG